MTISSLEKQIPQHLPPARLYLDDLAEIVRIFLEAEKNREGEPDSLQEGSETEIKFYVGRQVCDDIQDLPKIAKRPKQLTLEISKQRPTFTAYLRIGEHTTDWFIWGPTKQEQWSVFHKLETLFEKRILPWTNLLDSHSGCSYWIYGATSISLYFLLVLLLALYRKPYWWAIVVAFAAVAIPFIALRRGLSHHSIIILRNSWDHAAYREDLGAKVIIGAVTALIGALLGICGTLLGLYIRHKYWP